MKAIDAYNMRMNSAVPVALKAFYEAIKEHAPFSLAANLYEVAVQYDYDVLREVAKKLREDGYRVDYSDGEIRSTEIFRVCWNNPPELKGQQ